MSKSKKPASPPAAVAAPITPSAQVATHETNPVADELVTEAEYRRILLSQMRRSPDNRKRFDEPALTELGASIKAMGVVQPILVRPVTPTAEQPEIYEIVAGERRYRGSIIAGLLDIPAMVRVLTDLEAAKIRILENLQREDPHPMEEAEGYQLLMLQHGYNADQLADEIKKSRAYVYGRLKLCALCTEVRDEFINDKISASTALLIARIPVPKLQAAALYEILRPHGPMTSEPMSVRAAAEHIQRRYTLNLTTAIFKTTDAKLLAKAGACGTCPKRTGNQPEIFHGISADVCTDPECFGEKKAAHYSEMVALANKKGVPVLEGAECMAVIQTLWMPSGAEFVPADESLHRFERNAPATKNSGTALSHLGADGLPPVAQLTKGDDGVVRTWYKRTAMQAALEAAGVCETVEQHAERMGTVREAQQEPRQGNKDTPIPQEDPLEKKVQEENAFRLALYKMLRAKGAASGFSLDSLREFTKRAVWQMFLPDDLLGDVYDFDTTNETTICEYIDRAGLPEIQLLLIDLVVGEALAVGRDAIQNGSCRKDEFDTVLRMATHEGIDADELREEMFPTPINVDGMQQADLAAFIGKYPARLTELTETVLAHPRFDLIGMLERAAQQCGYTYTRGGFVLQDAAQADAAPTEVDPFLNQVNLQEPAFDAVALDGASLAEQIVDAAPDPKRTKGKATGKKLAPAVAWPFPKDSSGEREPEATDTTTPQTEATQEIAA